MNQNQYRAAYAIINKLKLQDQKENILLSISNGRTSSMRELSHEESIELIKYLKDNQDASSGRMRGKIFYYCHEMGWTKKNAGGKTVADGVRLDKWMIEFSYLKKKINLYTLEELPKLVSQFEQVYKSFLSRL